MSKFWQKIKLWQESLSAGDVAFSGSVLVFLLYVLPMIMVSSYNQPFHDDFCFAYMAQSYGFGGSLRYLYNTALGRYSSNTLLTIFGLAAKTSYWFTLVRIVPVILLILFFCTLLFFIFSLVGGLAGKREKIILAILVFVSSIASMPSLAEGIYWAASTLTHAFAVVIFLLMLGIIFLWYKIRRTSYRIYLGIAAAVLISAGVGMDENTMVLSILTALALLIISWKFKPGSRSFAGSVAAVTLLSVFFAIHSPGNWQRYGLYHDRLSFIFTIFASTYSTFVEMYKWFNPVMLLAALLALPFFVAISKKLEIKPLVHPIWVLLTSFGLLDILTAISIFSTGVNPVPRVWDVISWIFILLWFLNIFYVIHYCRTARGDSFAPLTKWFSDPDAVLITWVVFIFIALNGSNIKMVLEDFGRHRAQSYSAALNQRYANIQQAKKAGQKIVTISSPPVIADSLYVGDIEADPTGAGATCYAQYFGVGEIILK